MPKHQGCFQRHCLDAEQHAEGERCYSSSCSLGQPVCEGNAGTAQVQSTHSQTTRGELLAEHRLLLN